MERTFLRTWKGKNFELPGNRDGSMKQLDASPDGILQTVFQDVTAKTSCRRANNPGWDQYR